MAERSKASVSLDCGRGRSWVPTPAMNNLMSGDLTGLCLYIYIYICVKMMKNTDLRWSKRGSPLGLPTLKKMYSYVMK